LEVEYVRYLGVITRIGGWIFRVTRVANTSFRGMWSSIDWCSRCGGSGDHSSLVLFQ
jgi:hypothetical protein